MPDKSLPGGKFSNVEYVGKMYKDDVASEMSQLQDDIANYVPQEWPCAYISELGSVQCDMTCVSGTLDVPCPEKMLFDQERKLLQLKMAPFRRLALTQPDITAVNSVLDREHTVYSRA